MRGRNFRNIFTAVRSPMAALILLALLLPATAGLQTAQAQDVVAICDRTREVEDAIVAKIRESRAGAGCGDITRTELGNITDLTVHGYSRSAIRPSDFANLGRLEDLNIHGSATLTTIPADAFSGAPGVITLDLRGNAIKFIHRDAFRYHPRIRALNLGFNHIDYLPDGLFSNLSTLRKLRLHSNYLVAIRDGQFAGLDSLTLLNLADNKIDISRQDIDTAAFDDIPQLEILLLGGNELASLGREHLRKLTNLTELRLNNSGITSLRGDTFAGFAALQTLDLSENQLTSLPAEIFSDMSALQILWLQGNLLRSLPANIFTNNAALSDLNLARNGFTTLPSTVFSSQPLLFALNLSQNNLTGLDKDIFSGLNDMGFTNLTNLYLHQNNITSLHEDTFHGLGELCELTLRRNQLTTLHVDIFDENPCLEELDLRDNLISSLPATVFDSAPGLTGLYLGYNRLTSLPSGLFAGLTYMELLDLSNNRLTALDLNELDPFAGTLTYLDLSGNNFTTAPTNAALEAKLTAIEDYYVTQAPPTGIVNSLTIRGGHVDYSFPLDRSRFEIRYKATAPFGADSLTINVGTLDDGAVFEPHADTEGAFRIDDDNQLYLLYDRDPNTPGIQIGAPLSRRNVVEFLVDGSHYLIDVYRDAPSSNARLANLTLTRGVTLSPAFDSNRLEYIGFASHDVTFTVAQAVPMDHGATVVTKLNGVASAHNVFRINNAGPEVITVEVTAEDGVTTRTYRVVLQTKVTLTIAPPSLNEWETAFSAIVFAFLNKPSAQDTTVKITLYGTSRANLSSAKTIVIRAGSKYRDTTLPWVEITPNDNEHYLDYELRVGGTVIDNPEVYNPDDAYLTIIDDDLPVPDIPRNFVVTSEAGKTTFNWDNVTKPRDAARVRYDIFVRNPGESDDDWKLLTHTGSRHIETRTWPFFRISPDEGPVTSQRLPVGGTYEFALRAMSIIRLESSPTEISGSPVLGEFTAPVTHTVIGPNRPLDLEAERTVDGVGGPVRLTWAPPPLFPGGTGFPALMPVPNLNVDSSVVQYFIFRAEEPPPPPTPTGTVTPTPTPRDFGANYRGIGTVAGNVLTYTDSDASDDKAYFYRVHAVGPDGLSDLSGYGFVYPKPSSNSRREFLLQQMNPTNLSASSSSDRIWLNWDAVVGATSYTVFRRSPGVGYYVQFATSDTNAYTDTDVEAGETYGYVVTAENDQGSSGRSNAAQAMVVPPPPPPPPPPLAPTGLQASVGDGSVTLTWSAPDDDSITGYDVFRELQGADPPEDAVFVAVVDAATTTVTDTGVETGRTYTYSVQSINFGGPSEPATVVVTVSGRSVRSTAGPLQGFTLVDASDQTVLATLSAGSSVALADPAGGSYGLRADVDANATIGSVSLALSGAKTVSARTENVAPYSLYGDGGANALSGGTLPVGSYTLTATAYADSSLGGDVLGTLSVSFTVTQANRAPEFGSATYNFSIAEDATSGAAVGTVSATDADNHSLTYTIESGNGDGKFAIDGSSGAITTAGVLDHETTPSYTLTVQADDGNGGTDTATVNVTVTDVDETTTGPLEGFTLVDASDQTVLATLTAGSSVALADPAGGSYGIRADVDANAAIGSVELELSGAKTVSARTENVAPYSLYGDGGANALSGGTLPVGSYTVTATAYAESSLGGDELGTLSVSFTVTQANRAPEFGSATYNFSIAEDAASGADVGTVAATDADNHSLTYTIESGNGDGKFAIDGSSGAITTAGELDFEKTPSYTLTVQAADGNGGTATATVNVTVTDVAETTTGPLEGFTLVDASNQNVLATLTQGSSVALADPSGGSYGIRANVDANAAIGSVRLALSGAKTVSQTENIAPYSLYGDSNAGASSELNGEALPVGSYTLTATAYANSGLGGDVLGTLEISFTITASN